MRPVKSIGAIAAGALALACETTPLAEPASNGRPAADIQASAGVQEQAISGVIALDANGPPGGILVTPSGECHLSDVPGFTHFVGDVAGPVTFHRRVVNVPCAGGSRAGFTSSGPFDGEVTWNGLAGTIAGQWETNCRPDPSQPTGVSCDGTMNARGSGGLEGVQFHFKWGPGWFPFPYSGTAFSR